MYTMPIKSLDQATTHSYTVNPNQAPAFLLTLSLPAAAQVLVSPTKPSVALTNTKPTNNMKSLTKTEDSLWDCMSGTKQAQTL